MKYRLIHLLRSGEITGLVENTMIIKARTSGEFRILQEKSIFCFEDRTVIGPLFEIFGRVQQPVYSVKFNSEEQFLKFKESKGKLCIMLYLTHSSCTPIQLST